MTKAKPLTRINPETELRVAALAIEQLKATIEARNAEIKRLREALTKIAQTAPLVVVDTDGTKSRFDYEIRIAREALTATEPKL